MAKTSVHITGSSIGTTAFKRNNLIVYTDIKSSIVTSSKIPFILEGKVKNLSISVNEEIGIAQIDFPNKPFGTRIFFGSPICILANDNSNVLFRGFVDDEIGVISVSEDILRVVAYDYKWLLGKLPKIFGKIYSVDGSINPSTQASRIFNTMSLNAKFKYHIPGGSNRTYEENPTYYKGEGCGFIGSMKTIFNENGDPNAAGTQYNVINAFKFRPESEFANTGRILNDNYFHYFNYATIIHYICKYYIEDYFRHIKLQGGFKLVMLDQTSLGNILAFGQAYGMDMIIPKHLDITNMSPVQALDKVVKMIPGSWIWRLAYTSNNDNTSNAALIQIVNLNQYQLLSEYPIYNGKTIFIGNGGKINTKDNNNVNVKSLTAKVSIKDSISHAIAVGGPIQLETTIEYKPAWEQYLRPLTDFDDDRYAPVDKYDYDYSLYDGGEIPSGYYISNFKNVYDYEKYTSFINTFEGDEVSSSKKFKQAIISSDEIRFGRIFRFFRFPENKREMIHLNNNYPLANYMGKGYNGFAYYLHELIFDHVLRVRKIRGPITTWAPKQVTGTVKDSFYTDDMLDPTYTKEKNTRDRESPIFVFLYDPLLKEVISNDIPSGLDSTIKDTILHNRSFVFADVGGNDSNKLNYHFENDNRYLVFEEPQFQRYSVSFSNMNTTNIHSFKYAAARHVFASLRIECDVPLIADKLAAFSTRGTFYGNMQLVNQEMKENLTTVFRINAIYPLVDTDVGGGNTITYEQISNVDRLVVSTEKSEYSKLVDYGPVGGGVDVTVSDMAQINQIVQMLLNETPILIEEYDIELGKLDTSFVVGERISKIQNSTVANDPFSGYYNMNAFITKIEHTVSGKGDVFNTKLTLRNSINVQKQIDERD